MRATQKTIKPRLGNVQNAKYMTWTKIRKQYPNEWVFIANPKNSKIDFRFLGGEVIFANADHDKVWAVALKRTDINSSAVRWTGVIDF
jgi:hypothetical protein